MIIHRYGADVLYAVQKQVRRLREEKIDIIHALLNMEDPFTPRVVSALESIGFYFAGILPHGIDNQHCLIMQCLNNVRMDYEKKQSISPEASMVLDFIEKQQRKMRHGGTNAAS